MPVYGIKESAYFGNLVFTFTNFEDRPHINSIKVGDSYVKYEDIFLTSAAANKRLQEKAAVFPPENVELAEKLERMDLIDPAGFNDIMQNGVNSKTYKSLYENK